MTPAITLKLEFSPDALSNPSPSWVDVSRYCLDASWSIGKQRDLDDVSAGSASFRLDNRDRRFEPDYPAGAYYPNVVPLRQFRLTLYAEGTTYQHGVWYATSWDVTYPAGTAYSETVVSCTDALGLLSLYVLGPMDPPESAGIADVIGHDEPFCYYRMNDDGATTLIARKKRKHHHEQHRHRHRRHHQRHTPPVVTSDGNGPDGIYHGSPNYGEAGMVIGDDDTCVQFHESTNDYASIPLADVGQFGDANAFTAECIYRPNSESVAGDREILLGPWDATNGHSFYLGCQGGATDNYTILVNFVGGAGATVTSSQYTHLSAHHLAVTWNGVTLRLYVDGVLDGESAAYSGKRLAVPAAKDNLYIGGSNHALHMAAGWVDEVAFYERALPARRVKAHADAALRLGYPQQVEGVRVAALLGAAGTWNPSANVDAGTFQLAPVPHVGQTVLEELVHTVHASQPWGLLWFGGDGNPHYLGWDYLAVGSRSTPAGVFGDQGGEVPYTSLVLTYDDELYNRVTVARDGGEVQTATDAASQSAYLSRSYDDAGLVLALDADAAVVANAIRDSYGAPQYRVDSLTLRAAANPTVWRHTLARDVGDLIEVRRRGQAGVPVDVLTRIIGRSHAYTRDGVFDTTWSLARGWNATDGYWRLGVGGKTELGQNTVLA